MDGKGEEKDRVGGVALCFLLYWEAASGSISCSVSERIYVTSNSLQKTSAAKRKDAMSIEKYHHILGHLLQAHEFQPTLATLGF